MDAETHHQFYVDFLKDCIAAKRDYENATSETISVNTAGFSLLELWYPELPEAFTAAIMFLANMHWDEMVRRQKQ